MTKKHKSKKSEKQIKPSAQEAPGHDLSDEQLDKVTGGAVDAFIWFNQGGGASAQGETKDGVALNPSSLTQRSSK